MKGIKLKAKKIRQHTYTEEEREENRKKGKKKKEGNKVLSGNKGISCNNPVETSM